MSRVHLALKVPKPEAEAVRRKVLAMGLLDSRRKVVAGCGHLEIPIRSPDPSVGSLGEVVQQPEPVWSRRRTTPYQAVLEEVDLKDDLKALLPRRWEKVGDVLLLKLPPELRPHQEEACRAYAEVLRVKTILRLLGIGGRYRAPRVEVLWGKDTETVHKENGILFKLDLSRVMFSPGNIDERVRMARVCHSGEVVVDMFAGIGYFSLPMAVHGHARKVYACEVNPVAFDYLRENVRLNRAEAVEPVLGDCNEVAPEGVADRVVLGYLRDTHLHIPKALRTLRGSGWIHYHEACPDEAAHRLADRITAAAEARRMRVKSLESRRVKSYAPGVSHWVVDALIS